MTTPEVLAKRDAAVLWCKRASDHAGDVRRQAVGLHLDSSRCDR